MVPVTVISTKFISEMLRNWIDQGEPAVRKFAKIRDVDDVDLPTGHWTQFTRPEEPGRTILDAAAARSVDAPPVAHSGDGLTGEEP